MLSEPVIQGVLFMADEMLSAGAKELAETPEKESPLETVARIYTAMEVVRVMIEHMLNDERDRGSLSPEEWAKRLN